MPRELVKRAREQSEGQESGKGDGAKSTYPQATLYQGQFVQPNRRLSQNSFPFAQAATLWSPMRKIQRLVICSAPILAALAVVGAKPSRAATRPPVWNSTAGACKKWQTRARWRRSE